MGNISNANLLGKLGCSFIIISTFFCVVYLALLMANFSDHAWNTMPGGFFMFFKWGAALFITMAIICSMLNRTSWAGSASKGNWDNAYFYSGTIILVATILIASSIYLISDCESLKKVEAGFLPKIIRLCIVGLTLTCGWLLAQPDL